MNAAPESKSSRPWEIAGGIALVLVLAILIVYFLFRSIFSVSPSPVLNPPIPRGQAEIHVGFKGISTDKYNKLTAFVRDLAKEHSALLEGSDRVRDLGDAASFHGFRNNGYAYQRYRPTHPIPSPEVEKAMQERFKAFLDENGIDGGGESLELRDGQ